MKNFAAIDFETANQQRTSVCSVGIVIVRDGEIVDSYYSLIKPEPEYYSYWNTRVHGLTMEDTMNARVFPEVWAEIQPKIEGLPLVAHNSPFDEGCLKSVFQMYQMDYPDYEFHCTCRASRRKLGSLLPNHQLQTVAAYCGYDLTQHHNALADAEACTAIALQKLLNMRNNNKIGIVSISEIQGLDFIIPDYQRGYRWEELQVTELLKDLNIFIENSRTGFYCLQPLVVKRSIVDSKAFSEEISRRLDRIQDEPDPIGCLVEDLQQLTSWEVIDGQQRLTTLYIIMMVLKHDPAYRISYQTRPDSKDFLKNIIDKTNEDGAKNVDFQHMILARNIAQTWLQDKSDEEKALLYDTILERVKFIWYESVGENPIDVFTRLNIGKISLTNSELIKAALLNRSNYAGSHSEFIRTKQIQISSQWDDIEYALQDDELWLFLNDTNYQERTRIDFLFKILFENDCFGIKAKIKPEDYDNQIGNDRYSVYRYFAKQIEMKDEHTSDAEHLESIWAKVTSLFDTIKEWFEDSLLYHYIGFSIWAIDDNNHNAEVSRKWINDWYNQWMQWAKDKKAFLLAVKEAIRDNIIKCRKEDLNKLHFEDVYQKSKIRKILLLHNIQTIITQQEVQADKYKLSTFHKFPFHLFKKETWNVEHIDSATTNELANARDKKSWLRAALASRKLKYDGKIKKYLDKRCTDIPDFKKIYDKVMTQFPSDDLLCENVQTGDVIDNERMHIWNLSLLDESTNKSYRNSIFCVKRSFIINKEQGKHCHISDEGKVVIDGKAIAFVPICTKQAFLKYYTEDANALLSWSRTDSVKYLDDITEKLKDFLQ